MSFAIWVTQLWFGLQSTQGGGGSTWVAAAVSAAAPFNLGFNLCYCPRRDEQSKRLWSAGACLAGMKSVLVGDF